MLGVVAVGCGGSATGKNPAVQPSSVPKPASSHVATIVMENKAYSSVIGNRSAPYTNSLARRYGLATQSFAVTHPSLPNYLALTSGSTHGVTSDCTSCHVGGTNIVDQLEAKHISWKAYLESMPSACYRGAFAGNYAKKHNPFAYYDDVAGDRARCARLVPYSRLATDLRKGALPTYAFIAPNLCHDTHDCGVSTGDQFLSHIVPSLLKAVGPHGYVVLTYDEGSSNRGCCGGSAGGRIATIVAGPDVRRGARSSTPVDHYGVLGTIEDSLGLPRLGAAADTAHGRLDSLFRSPPRVAG
jgi:hypothetical protein